MAKIELNLNSVSANVTKRNTSTLVSPSEALANNDLNYIARVLLMYGVAFGVITEQDSVEVGSFKNANGDTTPFLTNTLGDRMKAWLEEQMSAVEGA